MAYQRTTWANGDVISADKLNNAENGIEDVTEAVGDLSDLTTTDKSSIVAAINEVASSGGGLTEEVKQALLQIAEKVAYIDDQGQTYYDALEDALYPPANLVSISAVYTQSGTVYDTDSLDSLKADLVVTAHYDNATTQTVTTYTLSGTLTAGTSTITVSYGGKTTTFSVTVSSLIPTGYTACDYISNETDNTAYARMDFPTADVDAFNYTFEVTCKQITSVNESVVFGGRDSYSSSYSKKGVVIYVKPTAVEIHYGNVATDTVILASGNISTTPADKHTFMLKQGKIYIDGTMVKDMSADKNAAYVMLSSSYKFGVFQRNNGGAFNDPYTGRVYGISVKDGNDNYLVRYIPCKRNADDVYGFYDVANNTFVTAYTSAFTGGNDA